MIAYYHHFKNLFESLLENKFKYRYTIAYESFQIDEEFLVKAVKDKNLKLSMKLGVAFCHKHDQYVKRIGRELALQNLSTQEFIVHTVSFSNDRADFCLSNDKWAIYGFNYFDSGITRIKSFHYL